MREILGKAKTVRELLKGVKYSIKEQSGLPFVAHPEFNKVDLETRSLLYRKIAERIWNPADLLTGGQA